MLTSAGDSVMSLETDMRPGDIKMWSNGEVEESPEEMETCLLYTSDAADE